MVKLLIEKLNTTAINAGEKIMEIYASDVKVSSKSDDSPVTIADKISEKIIIDDLKILDPTTPIIAEESVSEGQIPTINKKFWLIDPLDGTKEFINKQINFTVNIALIEKSYPSLGIIYKPTTKEIFYAYDEKAYYAQVDQNNKISNIKLLKLKKVKNQSLNIVMSKTHNSSGEKELLNNYNVNDTFFMGCSIKFCHLALGNAHLYPRIGRTMEWDTAAGHAILKFAGGKILTLSGEELRYGKKGFINPGFVSYAPYQQQAFFAPDQLQDPLLCC